jgi:hypothetical protein
VVHALLQVFVISGGFNGWTSAKLQTKFSSSVRACACTRALHRYK